jgi:hypothetical protein
MIVPSRFSMVLPCSIFSDNSFYLTHPYGSHLYWHDDIRIELPGLQFRAPDTKVGRSDNLGAGPENGTPFHGVVRSLCGRLAWFRTQKPAHSTTL